MTTRDLAAEQAACRQELLTAGHTQACANFWVDVLLMDAIKERWDHWVQPNCVACDARRARRVHDEREAHVEAPIERYSEERRIALISSEAWGDKEGQLRPACVRCGRWKCAECRWIRNAANLGVEHACGRCGSKDGVMHPVRHTGWRRYEH